MLSILLSCFLLNFSAYAEENAPELPQFIPSHEWKVILPGQTIPKGIHVRHNFENGLTEGKLMDPSSPEDKNGINELVLSDMESNDKTQRDSPATVDDEHSHKMNLQFDASNKFRTYRELKKDYETIMSSVKTEAQIIQKLFNEYEMSSSEETKNIVLQDLAEYLHQFDNAVNFANSGNLSKLVQELPDVPLPRKVYIARCLSSALQGNPPVKVKMFESGAMKAITQLWHQELHSSSSPNAKFLSDYLLVLSSILRHFPLSQKVFFAARSDGQNPVGFALLDATIKSPVWLCRDVQCQKLKLRIFGLLGDLLDERNTTDKTNVQKLQQYSEFDLAAGIRRYGWCREVVALITDSALLTDHSSRERALRAGLQIAQVCSPERLFGNEMDSKSLSNVLDGWEEEYSELARREVTDVSVEEEHLRYFASLLELLYRFRAVVYGTEKTFHPLRSEL